MRALIACESSGVVREAFRRRGWAAWSCDLQPADDGSPFHIQGDVRDALKSEWNLVIAHPPCTYLASSGLHWNRKRPERAQKTEKAIAFARLFLDLEPDGNTLLGVCVENPVGCLSTRVRKPTQIIQPHQFGDDASKATCLWLKGLAPLVPTKHVAPRIVNGKRRWANQTDSGQNRLGPSADRWKERSRTYEGIAEAMANQWG